MTNDAGLTLYELSDGNIEYAVAALDVVDARELVAHRYDEDAEVEIRVVDITEAGQRSVNLDDGTGGYGTLRALFEMASEPGPLCTNVI